MVPRSSHARPLAPRPRPSSAPNRSSSPHSGARDTRARSTVTLDSFCHPHALRRVLLCSAGASLDRGDRRRTTKRPDLSVARRVDGTIFGSDRDRVSGGKKNPSGTLRPPPPPSPPSPSGAFPESRASVPSNSSGPSGKTLMSQRTQRRAASALDGSLFFYKSGIYHAPDLDRR